MPKRKTESDSWELRNQLESMFRKAVKGLPDNERLLHAASSYPYETCAYRISNALMERTPEEQVQIARDFFSGFPKTGREHILQAIEWGSRHETQSVIGRREIMLARELIMYSFLDAKSPGDVGRFAAALNNGRHAVEAYAGLPYANWILHDVAERAKSGKATVKCYADAVLETTDVCRTYHGAVGGHEIISAAINAARDGPEKARRVSDNLLAPAVQGFVTACQTPPNRRFVYDVARMAAGEPERIAPYIEAVSQEPVGRVVTAYHNLAGYSPAVSSIARAACSDDGFEHARKVANALLEEPPLDVARAYQGLDGADYFVGAVAQAAYERDAAVAITEALLQDEVQKLVRATQTNPFRPIAYEGLADAARKFRDPALERKMAETMHSYLGKRSFEDVASGIRKRVYAGDAKGADELCSDHLHNLVPLHSRALAYIGSLRLR